MYKRLKCLNLLLHTSSNKNKTMDFYYQIYHALTLYVRTDNAMF